MAYETSRLNPDSSLKALTARLTKLQQSHTAHAAQFRGDILVRAIEEQIKDVCQKIADLTGAADRQRQSAGSSPTPKPRRTVPAASDAVSDLGTWLPRRMRDLGHP